MSDEVSRVREYLLGLQQRIVTALEAEDGQGVFIRDEWKKPPGEKLQGEGITRLMAFGDRGYAWVTLDLAGYRTGGGNGRTA